MAIGSDEDRALDAVEVFLDDDTRAGLTEATREELTKLLLSFLEAFADDDSLTSSQSISLQYIGRAERLEVVECFA